MERVLLKLNGFGLANIPNYGFTDRGLIDSSLMDLCDTVVASDEHHGCLH